MATTSHVTETAVRTEPVEAGYTSVLVPLDGSELAERALVPAGRLATALGAELHVVSNARHDERWWYERYLERLQERVRVTAHVSDDLDPATAIASEVGSLDPCIACLATHGRSRSAAIVGSTFARVVRHLPVVAVGPHVAEGSGDPDHLVVCLDGSAVGEQALPLAAAWARRLGWRVTLVTAADPVLVDRDVDAYLSHVAGHPELDGLAVDTRVLWGMEYPHMLISHDAAKDPTAVLVATTHARTGLARAALGSEVARILHWSPVPVLVRPATPA